jgi:hypothetical protein
MLPTNMAKGKSNNAVAHMMLLLDELSLLSCAFADPPTTKMPLTTPMAVEVNNILVAFAIDGPDAGLVIQSGLVVAFSPLFVSVYEANSDQVLPANPIFAYVSVAATAVYPTLSMRLIYQLVIAVYL